MGPYMSYSSIWVLIAPYSSFYVRMDSNVSLLVLIGPYLFSWVLIGRYSSFYVRMDCNVSYWSLGPYLSFWNLMGP